MVDAPTSVPVSNPASGPSPTPMGLPHSQGNYNYGQPAPYLQAAPPQSYGHGYNEAGRYENQAPSHHPYGGHGGSHPGGYPQGTYPGYPLQDQYGKDHLLACHHKHLLPNTMPSLGLVNWVISLTKLPSHQPSHMVAMRLLSRHIHTCQVDQCTKPILHMVLNLLMMGIIRCSLPQDPHVYPPQGGQPALGYGQPGGQQAVGYGQVAPTGGYGSYPSSQPGYSEQPTQNNACYGYQGAADAAYGSAPGSAYSAPTAHASYVQPAPIQPGYDQCVPHAGGYGSFPGAAPAGYGKSVSPQPSYPPGYDSSQMYGAHR